MVLNTASANNLNTTTTSSSSTSKSLFQKKRQSIDNSMIRFPKLDECAHFHYEFADLTNFGVSLIINENHGNQNSSGTRSSNGNDRDNCRTNVRNLYLFVRVQSQNRSWTVRRNLQDFRFLDIQLHKCVFDRKHSKLKPLNLTYFSSFDTLESIIDFVAQYLERLSQIVGGYLTCGPVLHWFEIDNRGNRLINEESDINTPAIGAAFVIKKHNKSDVETEISLEIGELISVIEMPPVNQSFYWKGKKGFEVGFFPAECVQLIDDKIFRKSGEYDLRPLKKCTSPTLRHRSFELENDYNLSIDNEHYSTMPRHGIIAALFRAFVSGRVAGRGRDQLKRSGILKERVFGCDLCEHLANSGHDLPLVLTACSVYIEQHGVSSNGIYRLSGVSSTIHRLRAAFDEERIPPELAGLGEVSTDEMLDIHAVSSLLKLYFRELPNPLLTFALYDYFVSAMRDDSLDADARLQSIRTLVISLPPPHWRTLRFLIRHLSRVSQFANKTGMTPKNLAIVWAPNLLRSRDLDQHVGIEALHVIGTQAVLTEFLILNCDKIFDREEYEIHPSKPLYSPYNEAKHGNSHISSRSLKYIDVGPEIIPGKYHTIISYRPTQSKRSKFNLQSWRKFHFFSARNHNVHQRPSLFGEEGNSVGGVFRKNNPDYSARENLYSNDYQQQLMNNSCCYHKTSSVDLGGDDDKSVKRSQSFDSYFKKLRTSNSCSNNNNCYNVSSGPTDEDDNDKLLDVNQNQFKKSISKNDTIYEVEEMPFDSGLGYEPMDKSVTSNDSCDLYANNGNNLMHSTIEEEADLNVTKSADIELSAQSIQDCQTTEILSPIDEPDNQPMDYHITSLETCQFPIVHDSTTSSVQLKQPNSPSHYSIDNSSNNAETSEMLDLEESHSQETLHNNNDNSSQVTLSSPSSPTSSPLPIFNHQSTNLSLNSQVSVSDSLSSSSSPSANSPTVEPPQLSIPMNINDDESIKENPVSQNKSPSTECDSSSSLPEFSLTENTKSFIDVGDDVSKTAVVSPVEHSLRKAIPKPTTTLTEMPELSARERIEKIKQERRNQIRQNLALKVGNGNVRDNSFKSKSLLRNTSIPSSGHKLPDVVNSSSGESPVKLRNKPSANSQYLANRLWRNSEMLSTTNNNEPYNYTVKPNMAKYENRLSVPNLESKISENLSQATNPTDSTPFTIFRTESLKTATSPAKYRRPMIVSSNVAPVNSDTKAELVSATPTNSKSSSMGQPPPPVTKMVITPLRTINKRQRVLDTKTLVQMFENHSTDKV